MPLDQGAIEDLLPDNTTEQISPQDLRDAFAQVAQAYDGLSVSYITADVTQGVGDGSIEGDVAAMDFSGNAVPDPAPDTFIYIPTSTLLQFAYAGRAYFWTGPVEISIGVGGTYTPVAADFILSGIFEHPQLGSREDADSHPTSAITGLDAAQTTQDGRLDVMEVSMESHVNPESLPSTNAVYLSASLNGADYSLLDDIPAVAEAAITESIGGSDVLVGKFVRVSGSLITLYLASASTKVTIEAEAPDPGYALEVYLKGYVDHTPSGGAVELVATSSTILLTPGRHRYYIDLPIPGPFQVEVGDLTILEVYASRVSGSGDDSLSLYVDGYGMSYSVTDIPVPALPYVYNKVADVLDIPADPTWTPINSVQILAAPAGVYELGFSVTGTFPNVTNSLKIRYRHDGLPWTEISQELKDITEHPAWYYAYPKVLADGDHTFEIEAQKSGSTDVFDIKFADVWIERKQ